MATSGTSRAQRTEGKRAGGHAYTRRQTSGGLGVELDPALLGWDRYAVEEVGEQGVGRTASFEVSALLISLNSPDILVPESNKEFRLPRQSNFRMSTNLLIELYAFRAAQIAKVSTDKSRNLRPHNVNLESQVKMYF